MPVDSLKDFLNSRAVRYVSIHHSPAYTGRELAEVGYIPRRRLAKTAILRVDGTLVMVVLPSSHKMDFERIKEVWNARHVEAISEHALRAMYPHCSKNGVPPFGNLYGMEVYVAEALAEQAIEIAFNTGSTGEVITMAYRDYAALVEPSVIPLPTINRYYAELSAIVPDSAGELLESHERCFLGISLEHANSYGARLEASLEWISKRFSRCAVFVADGIHRHTLQLIHPGLSGVKALDRALRLGRAFLEQERHVFDGYSSACSFEFSFCSEIQSLSDYAECYEQLKHLFRGDRSFKTSIESFADTFASRQVTAMNGKTAYLADLSTAYLLEELAAFTCLASSGWPVMVYPGSIGPLEAIAQGLHPGVPEPLRRLINVSIAQKKRRR